MRLKKSDYILLIILLIFVVTFIQINYFSSKSEPLLLNYASNKSTNIINSIINQSINNKIYNYRYDNIIEIEKDNNDNITSINFNNETVNNMLYIITDEIINNIKLLEENNYDKMHLKYISNKDKVYYIPYGVAYTNNILSNIGPKIPFKVSLIGSTNNDTKINVKEYGINSSMVEVVLNVSIKVQVILPFKSRDIVINKTIILDSKIIQGKIPNYYGGLYSAN